MTHEIALEQKITLEQEAYKALLDEKVEKLSEAAESILAEADRAALATNLVSSYCFQPGEYDEAMERMRLAATRITQQDHEILAEMVQAGFSAALSIDPDDETPAPYNVYWGNYYWYYRMASGMVDEVLQKTPKLANESEEDPSTKSDEECATCQDDVALNEELERDIRVLQGMLMATEQYLEEVFERHCDSPDFDSICLHLASSLGGHDELLALLLTD